MKVRLGTRGSKLALVQSNLVKDAIEKKLNDAQVELVEIKTIGDRKQGTSAAKISDKRDWVYDLEMAIVNNDIDMAVHSGKDIPIDIEEGTELFPVLGRANPYDAFVGKLDGNNGKRLRFTDLPQGANVGTASLRRRAYLLRLRPDLNVVEHRGNVPTRVKKMDDGDSVAGVVLASAGLERLGLHDLQYADFDGTEMIPGVNQGILVVQCRSDDNAMKKVLSQLVDRDTYAAWQAERTVAEVLDGDCKSAVGIFATCAGDQINLTAAVMLPDGKEYIEVTDSIVINAARELGLSVGEQLLAQGAEKILEASRDFS